MSLADVVLVSHALIAAFIVLGFAVIPMGAWLNWRFIRRRWLRLAHVGAIVFVAVETLAGIACPLTVWEDRLRGAAGDVGFIARWVRALLYYDVPLWVFSAIYVAAAVLAVGLWFRVPPDIAARRR